MSIPGIQNYSPPRAEVITLYFGQAILEGSSTLNDGREDGGWDNDIY